FGLSNGAGAIAIEASSATTTPAIRVTSRTFTPGVVGTYGQSVPNVSSDDLASTLLLTGLESDANFRTNIGLVNRTALPVNPGLTTMTVALRYLAAGQDNRGAASHSIAIAPSRTVVIADVAQSLGVSSGSGALQVSWTTASGPIVTSRTYITTDNGGTYGQS